MNTNCKKLAKYDAETIGLLLKKMEDQHLLTFLSIYVHTYGERERESSLCGTKLSEI